MIFLGGAVAILRTTGQLVVESLEDGMLYIVEERRDPDNPGDLPVIDSIWDIASPQLPLPL